MKTATGRWGAEPLVQVNQTSAATAAAKTAAPNNCRTRTEDRWCRADMGDIVT
jgi:hypothetical protein